MAYSINVGPIFILYKYYSLKRLNLQESLSILGNSLQLHF